MKDDTPEWLAGWLAGLRLRCGAVLWQARVQVVETQTQTQTCLERGSGRCTGHFDNRQSSIVNRLSTDACETFCPERSLARHPAAAVHPGHMTDED